MLIFGNWGGVPAVPEQPDGGLVPPVKVLRRRLNGVYRADGFSGPTRRYVLIVALLVGLASLPTLAAITVGSNELDRGTIGAMDVPFLPPASSGPVEPPPSSSALHGQAGKRRTIPHRYDRSDAPRSAPHRGAGRRSGSPTRSIAGVSPQRPRDVGSGRPELARPDQPGHRARPPASGQDPIPPGHSVPPKKPAEPVRPADPDEPAPPGIWPPLCHERGKCGVPESRHHRPDRSRHRHCEKATMINSSAHDRSEHTRRSTVTERPSNVRPPQWGDRTHNSRRHRPESRWDDDSTAGRSYRGAHRVDDVEAHDRSSRVGRHHAGRHHDRSDRW
jgi:hypothetical protein